MRLGRDDSEEMSKNKETAPVTFAHPSSVEAMLRRYFSVAVHESMMCLGMACFEIIKDKLKRKLGSDYAHVPWRELCRRGRGRDCAT